MERLSSHRTERIDLLRDRRGCDVELFERGHLVRGPMARFEIVLGSTPTGEMSEVLYIDTDYLAKYQGDEWEVIAMPEEGEEAVCLCGVNLELYDPVQKPDGSIEIDIPYIGTATIYPKGKNIKASGLPVSSGSKS